MDRKIPKVLIVGAIFNSSGGMGITMTNLFRQFPKSHLAVIAPAALARSSDLSLCSLVYQLGSKEERKIPYLLSLLRKKRYSGQITDMHIRRAGQKGTRTRENHSIYFLKNSMKWILMISGLVPAVFSYSISVNLDSWIKEFKPDLVYSALASVAAMRLVAKISKKYSLPVVIHMYDDWPKIVNAPSVLYFYWQRIIDKELISLTKRAPVLLGISETMRTEYRHRYHRNFIPFYNPVETKRWLRYRKKNWSVGEVCKILYLGAINISNNEALHDVSRAVDELNSNGKKIQFDIYSYQTSEKIAQTLKGFKGVHLRGAVLHQEIPKLMSSYDLNFLPLNLTGRSAEFTKLSLSTKTSEYMVSGVPTIVYANSDSAYTRYALKYRWASVVSVRDQKILKSSIIELIENEPMRKMIAKNAISYATKYCERGKVSHDFKVKISQSIKKPILRES